jgi:hypothetical protein
MVNEPVNPLRPQGLRGPQPGKRRTDDHHPTAAQERRVEPRAGSGRYRLSVRHLNPVDVDGLHRAGGGGPENALPLGLVGIAVKVQRLLAVHHEDVGRQERALPVALTFREIDDEPHRNPPVVGSDEVPHASAVAPALASPAEGERSPGARSGAAQWSGPQSARTRARPRSRSRAASRLRERRRYLDR